MWFPSNHPNPTFYYLQLIPQMLHTQPKHQCFVYAVALAGMPSSLSSPPAVCVCSSTQVKPLFFRKLFPYRIFWPSHIDCYRSFDSECPHELQTRLLSRYTLCLLTLSLPVSFWLYFVKENTMEGVLIRKIRLGQMQSNDDSTPRYISK